MSDAAPNSSALSSLKAELLAAVEAAKSSAMLDDLRVSALGKKGSITEQLKTLGALPAESRAAFGAEINKVKTEVAEAIEARAKLLGAADLVARLEKERVDVTLSPRPADDGRVHPLSQTIDEIITIFGSMGFALAKGPNIESDWNNFTALNVPPNHPARQMQDTFYLPSQGEGEPPVLRTQTSPVQIRTMTNQKPPIRIIAPGRTYRVDSDATHSPMFHQFEGLVVDQGITMAHLRGCLEDFFRAYFNVPDLPLRFRPSHFPFTEPSAEVDIGCSRKGGELKIGNYGDWLEVAGCGMVHAKVLKNCGLDPDEVQGFAFGTGIERIAMLKYGIPDLRPFYDADMRWLKHYGFLPLDIPNPALSA